MGRRRRTAGRRPTRAGLTALALAALALVGCTSSSGGAPEPRPSSAPSADDLARTAAVDDEVALLAAYRQAMSERPELTARLGGAANEHAEHLDLLRPVEPSAGPSAGVGSEPAGSSPLTNTPAGLSAIPAPRAPLNADPSGSAETSSVPPPDASPGTAVSPAPTRAPRTAATILTDLRQRESAAAAERLAALPGISAALARQLASLAAAGTVQATALTNESTVPPPEAAFADAALPVETSAACAAAAASPSGSPSGSPAPSGSSPPASTDPAAQPWIAVLAAEHAALWSYGLAGAHLAKAEVPAARAGEAAHRSRRDWLENHLCALGVRPAAALPAYSVPTQPSDAATAAGLLALVEQRESAALAGLVAGVGGADRTTVARWLQASAVRAAGWAGSTQAFPGLPEQLAG